MTIDTRPSPPPEPPAQRVLRRQQRWALVASVGLAVGLGAMLGHGLGQSLSGALPAAWAAASAGLLGAAVALLLVPLAAWVTLRIVAPALPRRAALALVGSPSGLPSGLPSGSSLGSSLGPTLRSFARAPGPAGRLWPGDLAAQQPAEPQAPARDALTGAYTQAHFVAAADREWSRIRRHGEDAALLMIDIDHFKRLNDEHGSACGDAMLVEITRQASTTLRPYDLLSRFGGGVLVVYLPHTDPLGALDVAERIRDRVAALRLDWHGKKVKATVSVGATGIGVAHAGLDAVIADAGTALREAKAAGRNCVRAAPIPPRKPVAGHAGPAMGGGWH